MKNYTFVQRSGLNDRHGKEIYEGNICKCTNRIKYRIFEVGFEKGSFVAKFKNGTKILWDIMNSNDIEIIGNIYKNELLTSRDS